MPSPTEFTVTQLRRPIRTPDCPLIVDISIDPDFDHDPHLIPGAFRHPHTDVDGLKALINGRDRIITCQQAIKLCQRLVAWVRGDGIVAPYLQGGNYAWRDAIDTIRIPASAIPAFVDKATLWLTRHRPKIDRIACPWLIRRFVDRKTQLLFVSAVEVMGGAERYGATPFGIEGVAFSHHGQGSTFDAMLDRFHLHLSALDRLARIVRATDTNRHNDAPEAAGLLALSAGLSRQYKDDQQQKEAGMAIYDALCRWARDGQNEGHAWPQERR